MHGETRDLSARQLAIFLTCYLDDEATNTVRGLAAKLNISAPGVSMALRRRVADGLAKRMPDPSNGRSILIGFTPAGTDYLRNVRQIMTKAAA